MYKRFCVGICLAAGLVTALAQPGAHSEKAPAGQGTALDNPAQRQALRNALQAQRSMGAASHPGARAGRELTAQERGELRQQLRQQRREFANH